MSDDDDLYGFDDVSFGEEEEPVSNLENSHPDQADPITQPKLVRQQPGTVRTSGVLLLHSRQAHRLFYGRRRDEGKGINLIVGLTRFSSNVRHCWEASANDDPYADLVLLDIETAYEEAIAELQNGLEHLASLLSSIGGISFSDSASASPVEIPLEFGVPWGFRGANLLALFDRVVMQSLTARHVGLFLDTEWHRFVHSHARRVRKVFAMSLRWHSTRVTRNDIAANNQVAIRASERHGGRVLPPDVMRGDRRAKLSPTLHNKVSEGMKL